MVYLYRGIMEDNSLQNFIDHQRWLIKNGLFTDIAKDNIYLYGSLVHKDITALHVVIDKDHKCIEYKLYVKLSLLNKVISFNNLRKSDKLIDMWRLRRLVKKDGNLDFALVLNRFVRDFCGSEWRATVSIHDIAEYRDEVFETGVSENQQNASGFSKT